MGHRKMEGLERYVELRVVFFLKVGDIIMYLYIHGSNPVKREILITRTCVTVSIKSVSTMP